MDKYESFWKELKHRVRVQRDLASRRVGASGSWSVVSRLYDNVEQLMNSIENGTENKLVPYNGLWRSKEYVEEITKKKKESND